MVPEATRRDIISTDRRRVATLSLPGGQIQLELGWQVALLFHSALCSVVTWELVRLTCCPVGLGAQRGMENKEGSRRGSYPCPFPKSMMGLMALLTVCGPDVDRLSLTPYRFARSRPSVAL